MLEKVKYVAISLFVPALVSAGNQKSAKNSRPNIILINIDDMGWKDLGFMGSNYYETPNIDRLSREGMVFANGYAAASNSAPSRACLMTGLWTPRHGIYTVGSSERGASKNRRLVPTANTDILAKKHVVIPQILNKNGYITCHSGKWHLSDNPLEYGFDVNIGGSHAGQPSSYYPPYKNVKLKADNNEFLTDLITRKTIEFIDTVSSPFFLYYASYSVHTPITPVKELVAKYTKKPGADGQQNAQYATMVENLDKNIGLLIDKLEAKGIMENTLIVFTSDNGGVYGITNQHPLRAGKGSYYEGGIREPFFVVLKNRISANTKSDVPVTNLDIFPTILAYAGISDAQLKLDGNDISFILEEKKQKFERPLFWHFPIYLEAYGKSDAQNRDFLFRTRPGSVVRLGDWKLHYYFEDKGVELYNLAEDVGEKNNLASKEPKKTKELLGLLKKWWKKTGAPIPKELNTEYDHNNQ